MEKEFAVILRLTFLRQIMFKRFKILFIFVSIALMAMAQEVSTESLDSIINALELKEVIVTAKKIRQSGDTISYSAATYRGKTTRLLKTCCERCRVLK